MSNDYEKLFSHLERLEPPAGLTEKILLKIKNRQKFLIIRRLVASSIGAITSIALFIPALKTAQAAVMESGFLQFFSLLFYDFKIVIANWQSFSLSLLESLPVMGLVMVLAVILIFLGSLNFLIKNIKLINKPLLINA